MSGWGLGGGNHSEGEEGEGSSKISEPLKGVPQVCWERAKIKKGLWWVGGGWEFLRFLKATFFASSGFLLRIFMQIPKDFP